MRERKPRQVPVPHAVDAATPKWCTCGRPSLESGAAVPGLLAIADGLEPPPLGAQEWMPLPYGDDV